MNSPADTSWEEFIKGMSGNHISDPSYCRCCLESSSSEIMKDVTTDKYKDLLVEHNRKSKVNKIENENGEYVKGTTT